MGFLLTALYSNRQDGVWCFTSSLPRAKLAMTNSGFGLAVLGVEMEQDKHTQEGMVTSSDPHHLARPDWCFLLESTGVVSGAPTLKAGRSFSSTAQAPH